MKGDLKSLCQGLNKLVIVDVALNREQDNPQLIFESMNSTGRELSQADLIRNFVLMGLEPKHQTKLYEEFWRPMEVNFGQEAYGSHFDGFTRHYLTIKTGEIPNVRAVYEAFKQYARQPAVGEAGVDRLVEDIHTFAAHYCAMALGKETDKGLGEAFQDLRELKVEVAYPFLLELYHDYSVGTLDRDDFIRAVRANRIVRFPPGYMRDPYELDEQDFRYLPAGSQEGPLYRKHRGVVSATTILPSFPWGRRVHAGVCGSGSLQLQKS